MIQLLLLTFFCLLLSVSRMWYTESTEYLFMNWNLFLAILPFVLSSFLVEYESIYPRVLLVVVLLAWLIFFPNGPYLITDLMHLRDHRKNPLLWFDLILFFSYAYLGMRIALESAKHIESVLARYMRQLVAKIVMGVVFFAVAFGIYLGRFLRFNSWDLFLEPMNIAQNIADCLTNPSENLRAYAMTAFFGLMLNVVYFSSKDTTNVPKDSK